MASNLITEVWIYIFDILSSQEISCFTDDRNSYIENWTSDYFWTAEEIVICVCLYCFLLHQKNNKLILLALYNRTMLVHLYLFVTLSSSSSFDISIAKTHDRIKEAKRWSYSLSLSSCSYSKSSVFIKRNHT